MRQHPKPGWLGRRVPPIFIQICIYIYVYTYVDIVSAMCCHMQGAGDAETVAAFERGFESIENAEEERDMFGCVGFTRGVPIQSQGLP